MTCKEKHILDNERKQINAFLSALRTESNTIGSELSGLIKRIAKIRTAQLALELLVTEFEKKIK